MVLIRLGHLTGRDDLCHQAEMVLKRNWDNISPYPPAFAMSLTALDYLIGPSSSLVLATEGETPTAFLDIIHTGFHPRMEIMLSKKEDFTLAEIAPLAAGKTAIKNQATAWFCPDRSCKAPVFEP